MVQFKPPDPTFPIQQQLEERGGPVVLVNLFTLDQADEGAFLQAWTEDAAYMKTRPGYISTQLHRAVGGSCSYLNSAVWESVELFRDAFLDPTFRARLEDYPLSAVASPHLFKRLAVPGICVA